MMKKTKKKKRRRTTTRTGSKSQRGGAWKSSLSLRSRRQSWPKTPGRRPRCRSGSSPSQRLSGIESARSKTRPSNWKRNPSSPTAAGSAPRASRSPVTLSGKYRRSFFDYEYTRYVFSFLDMERFRCWQVASNSPCNWQLLCQTS